MAPRKKNRHTQSAIDSLWSACVDKKFPYSVFDTNGHVSPKPSYVGRLSVAKARGWGWGGLRMGTEGSCGHCLTRMLHSHFGPGGWC